MVIQNEKASFTTPDGCQLRHFRSERPFAAINCVLDLSGCDSCEESRRQIGVEIHGRLVDANDYDCIATLSSLITPSAISGCQGLYYIRKRVWLCVRWLRVAMMVNTTNWTKVREDERTKAKYII